MSAEEKRPLAEGWREVPLEDVAHVERGITFPASAKSKEPFEDGIVCLRTSNVQEFVDWDDLLYVPKTYVKKFEKLLREHDILISMANSYELVGKVSYVSGIPLESSFGGFIAVIRTNELIEPKYLFYHLRTSDTQESMRRNSSQTVNIANLSLRTLYPTPIRIAPLPEQKRIVAEIEKQFTRLDQAVASLKRAQANMGRYKASVLKAACEGRLVPQDPNDETAEKLLQRILTERRRQWEEQEWAKLIQKAQKKVAQARRKVQGRPARLSDLEPEEWQDVPEDEYGRYLPKNDKWKEKYKEPKPPDTAELPPLPEGWVWTRVEQINNLIQYGTSDKASLENTGVPVLRMGNIQDGQLDFENLKYMPERWDGVDSLLLDKGDVLFNRTNSAELVGKTAVYKNYHPESTFASYLIRVRLLSGVSPDYLSFYINSVFGRLYIASVVSQQVGQANVNGTKLSNMPVPLPSFTEQERIVAEVERRLSVIAANEKAIAADLARAERLRQSILQQAFRGQLV